MAESFGKFTDVADDTAVVEVYSDGRVCINATDDFLDFEPSVAIELANAILKAAGAKSAQPVINVNVALAQGDIEAAVKNGVYKALEEQPRAELARGAW